MVAKTPQPVRKNKVARMKDISGELIYLVLFALVFVGQYLFQLVRKGHDALQDDAPREAQQQAWHPAPDEPPAAQILAPLPAALPAIHKNRRYGPAMSGGDSASAPKRFSRAALLGSKRRTQDAVVAMVILGPCRADLPYDNGQQRARARGARSSLMSNA